MLPETNRVEQMKLIFFSVYEIEFGMHRQQSFFPLPSGVDESDLLMTQSDLKLTRNSRYAELGCDEDISPVPMCASMSVYIAHLTDIDCAIVI